MNLWASLVAQKVKSLPAVWETQVQSLDWEDPWRRKWQPTPVFLPRKPHGQRSLVVYSPWSCEGLDTTGQLYFLSLSNMVLVLFDKETNDKQSELSLKFRYFKMGGFLN